MNNGVASCIANVDAKLNLESDNFICVNGLCSESKKEKKKLVDYLSMKISFELNGESGSLSCEVEKEKFSSYLFSFYAIGADRKNESTLKLNNCELGFKIISKTEGLLSIKADKVLEFKVKNQDVRNFQGKLLRIIRML